ncbi:MAG: hypothetical protein QMC80_02305, partial [Thermoplasmatales archaeon]|nr:hypothetical protein [Thermoplasmatales archaeon]
SMLSNCFGDNGMAGIEGLNNFVGGDNWGLGNNNNNFVDGMLLGELTDSQWMNGWTVMTTYIDNEMQTNEYTFKTNPTQNQSSILDSDRDGISDSDEMYPVINYVWYVNEVKEKAQDAYDDEYSSSSNTTLAWQAYNDTYQRGINAQFNPFVRENRPPIITSVYIYSDVGYHWSVESVVSSIWGVLTGGSVKVIDHCWTKVTVTVQDVSGISSVKIGVTDRNRWKTFTGDDAEILGNNKYKFSTCIDIDYWADYLVDYTVKVIIKDGGGNSISFEQKINGVFGGFLDFLGDIWDAIVGAVTAAIEFAKNMLNAIKLWVLSKLAEMLRPIIQGLMSIKDDNGMLENNDVAGIINDIVNNEVSIESVVGLVAVSLPLIMFVIIKGMFLEWYILLLNGVTAFASLFMITVVISIGDFTNVYSVVGKEEAEKHGPTNEELNRKLGWCLIGAGSLLVVGFSLDIGGDLLMIAGAFTGGATVGPGIEIELWAKVLDRIGCLLIVVGALMVGGVIEFPLGGE